MDWRMSDLWDVGVFGEGFAVDDGGSVDVASVKRCASSEG
jgi:hypothetical protein